MFVVSLTLSRPIKSTQSNRYEVNVTAASLHASCFPANIPVSKKTIKKIKIKFRKLN